MVNLTSCQFLIVRVVTKYKAHFFSFKYMLSFMKNELLSRK